MINLKQAAASQPWRQPLWMGALLFTLVIPTANWLALGGAGNCKAAVAAADNKAKVDGKADDGKTRDITFDDIKFDIEKGAPFERQMLTEKIEELQGRRVKIRGYMLPSFQQRGIRQFVLVRDNMECCFGPGAALYDCIVVEMAAGKSTQFTVRPIAVEGRFKVKELLGPDGKHLAIYEMLGDSVK